MDKILIEGNAGREMSDLRGLTTQQVKEQQRKGLVNGNFSVKTKSIGQIIFTNLFTLFNFVNLCLALCLFLVHSYKNMLFLGVVLSNGLIGIVQEIRSKKIIDKLSLLSAPNAIVIRDGQEQKIEVCDIVLGDYIVLRNGNQVCVDGCILEGECEVNESLLTGESDPVYKCKGDEVLSGSYLISGNVITEAIHVGKENYVNTITSQAKKLKRPNSEIMRSIKAIIKFVSILLIPIGGFLFWNQISTQSFNEAVVGAVAGVLGMIPSGLVLLTSMVLAVSVVKLGRKNTLVQELYCIETLARVDTLCLDKTGTITEGTMSVESFIDVDENDLKKYDGEAMAEEKAGERLEKAIADFVVSLNDNNPTYNALKAYVEESELLRGQEYKCEKKIREAIGFSSDKKWSMVDFCEDGCYVLGALEFMFDHPNETVKKLVDGYSAKGLRVLVFAHSPLHTQNKELPKELKAMGIILLSDTIRSEAPETFRYFINQGVNIKVISGDNPKTVSYVAGKAGVLNAGKYIDATLLATEEDIKAAAEKYTVFGRVTPNQKLELIKALKEKGHTVAMTGDGVNDVMALREADCSIAMQSGSDAARNVSQLVLMDSNFASMPSIVAEGRQTINNLQRSASLYLTKTIYSTVIALLFVILPVAYPFIPIQMTFIGGLAIGMPSFVLALEPNMNRVKGKFLVNVLKMAIPGALLVITNIVLVQIFAFIFGVGKTDVSTLSLYGLAIAALLQLFKCCKPFNTLRRLMCAVLIGLFAVGVIFFKGLLGLTKLSILELIFIAALIVSSIMLYAIYSGIIGKLLGSMPNIYNIHILYSEKSRIVIVEDDVDRKDYYDVASQMKGLKVLGADKVVYIGKPENGGDIRLETAERDSDKALAAAAARYYIKKNKLGRKEKVIKVETDANDELIDVSIATKEHEALADGEKYQIRYIKKLRITF